MKKALLSLMLCLLVVFSFFGSPANATETDVQASRTIFVENSFESSTLLEECDDDGCAYWAPLEITNFGGGLSWEIAPLRCKLTGGSPKDTRYRIINGAPYVCTKQYDEYEQEWYYYADECELVYKEYTAAQ